jgi:pyruvate-ferredoxin/flavodoxin oxidoreductase
VIKFGRSPKPAELTPSVEPRYPGTMDAMDGSTAVVLMETSASEAAGAYPITPSTQMGEGWAVAVAEGKRNVNGRKLLFFEPEGEHAAAAVTAGMSMTGMRAANFSSGQGIVYMHESLYPAVGKRLTYILNVAARAITKHALNVHAGHDDYHAIDDTGFFQLFAKDVQESADLNLIAHRIAELALNPGVIAQDGFLTSHVIESMRLPERDLIREYLGDPADIIDSPTPSQRLTFGAKRRRIPELFDVDHPAMLGVVQNQDSYAQGVAAQRPFYFDHVAELTDRAMREFAELTGRRYARAIGYRLDDADWVIAGQGSVVANAEAVADFLRETRGLKVGVLNLTMFRPFPADIVTRLLAGKQGVVVLERTDQPLAVEAPLLRELRAAMSQAAENGRVAARDQHFAVDASAGGVARRLFGRSVDRESHTEDVALPYPALPAISPTEIPDFFSGCFGLGSRDLQPGDIVAAVENMLPSGAHRRQFYLSIDFIRDDKKLPKLQIWQEELLESYPHLRDLALPTAGDLDLLPKGSVSVRIHSVGGWGAITMGKNLTLTVFELLGRHVKANPKYGSEKKGQPTTFYASFAHEPIRLNCELKHVDVVLSPDPNVFRHSNPLAGLAQGGVFVIQSDVEPDAFWKTLPASARREIGAKGIKVYILDAFAIAASEASDAELRYRMQGAAFMGAFFATSPLLAQESLSDATLFDGIRAQLQKKFGGKGAHVVEDNLRVIRRGFEEMREVATVELPEVNEAGNVPVMPSSLDVPNAEPGIGNPGRFWEQVCSTCKLGQDVIADPFAAISAMPAATSVVRDMTGVRMEVPNFIADKCTGCAQCWTQCPDAAIPGLVSDPEDILATAMKVAAERGGVDKLRAIAKPLGKELRRVIDTESFATVPDSLDRAWSELAPKLSMDAEKRTTIEGELAVVREVLDGFRFAKTQPFWNGAERKQKGSGGLLSITVNPEACKGCNLCVEVCPDGALESVRQDDAIVTRLRDEWSLWKRLPDTPQRFVNVSNIDEGIGVLPTLLLRKGSYGSMAGGDGACMGCGEKTTVHLITSTIEAMMAPRVERYVAKLRTLTATLEQKTRELLAADIRVAGLANIATIGDIDLPIDNEKRREVELLARVVRDLESLAWRYVEGPSGLGRSRMAMANSTGCSSVWASTYPYNPYPFPWANHLFQDSPSLAIGLFEGHMRKMADGFAIVRRAQALADGTYDAELTEREIADLDWKIFTDEEFALCPPIFAMGGDGAMLDIGFQNLSRLMASGKPIRVIVLDTQVYSNTGGQACTSGFTGQVSDMAWYGGAQHGKSEARKELALIALAHRGVFVHQTSQASASHLMAGVLRGMQKRRPVLINVYTPCPVEHGLSDNVALHAARLALESRAFPYLTFDPDAGTAWADCLSLDGNPSVEDDWPSYTLDYVDEQGETRSIELPLTIADWAATEGRFRKHFKKSKASDEAELVLFHEYVALSSAEREAKTPFIYVLGADRKAERWTVSDEIVRLAEERLQFWAQLRELAGVVVPQSTRDRVNDALQSQLEEKLVAMRQEFEAKLADLKATYPTVVARQLADGLLKAVPQIGPMIAASGFVMPTAAPVVPAATTVIAAATTDVVVETPTASPSPQPLPSVRIDNPPAAKDDTLTIDPYIESERCTSCNECTNVNKKMFTYNADKQAYIKDASAGTFAQLVQAAEKCPVGAIHPGTPVNPKEKDLEKWLKRAQAF